MRILPAIDILDGKVVRLFQGNYEKVTFYPHTPQHIAKTFLHEGYSCLHVIDLFGAKSGAPRAMKELEAILAFGVEIQCGGGIRTLEHVRDLLSLGARRVIIGTQALLDPLFIDTVMHHFSQEAIMVSVDVRNGKIATHGWLEEHSQSPAGFLRRLEKQGITQVILTDISRDGTLQGTNRALYRPLVQAFPNIDLYAAGGIRGQCDIDELQQIGVAGAIVGRAFYESKKRIKIC